MKKILLKDCDDGIFINLDNKKLLLENEIHISYDDLLINYKELLDIIKKIIKLENQIDKPDRNGMIDALKDAQSVACNEIVQNIQQSSSFFYSKPWVAFSDKELYNMLPQYKQGLINHGIAKIGEGAFEKLLEECFKQMNMR